MNVMKVFNFVSFLFFINFSEVSAIEENVDCDYDHCEGQNFICATNGNDFQYFRNVCYMKTFNDCNKSSE